MASDQLVDDILELWRMLRRSTNPALRGEITMEQYWLLRLLRMTGGNGMSIGDLAEGTGVGQSSISTACQRLEKAGLVARKRDEDDERVVLVRLTDEGRAQMERWRQARRVELAHMLEPLDDEELETLKQLMRRVVEHANVEE